MFLQDLNGSKWIQVDLSVSSTFLLLSGMQDPGPGIPPALCQRGRAARPRPPHILPVGIRISWSWSLTPPCPCHSTGPPEMGSTSFQIPIESRRFSDSWRTLGCVDVQFKVFVVVMAMMTPVELMALSCLVDVPNPGVDQSFSAINMDVECGIQMISCSTPRYPYPRTNPYQETWTFASKIWIDYIAGGWWIIH